VSPTATTASVTVERRFNGPPASANGGYACGLVARHVDGPAEVSLRRPVPLETPLEVERHEDGSVTLHDGAELLAEGGPALPLDLEPPYRPSVAEAREAARSGFGPRPDVFSHCYVCAAPHDRADGLGVHFGALPSRPDMTGAVLEGGDGVLAPEIAWAALDCPSYTPALWNADRPSLLARLTAELLEPVALGEPVVVCGWTLSREGRKHESATALLGADGRILALAQALWIELRVAPATGP
jgi:hypothetical protein